MASAVDNLNSIRSPMDEGDQEGWMVAYADLITLLFIFFSLIISVSVVSRSKFELLTKQFNENSTADLLSIKIELDNQIAEKGLQQDVSTGISDEGLSVQFSESTLFPTAESNLTSRGHEVLGSFVEILKGISHQYRMAIDGHTDSRPIHTAKYPSNWALSAERSVNVLHFFSGLGMDEKRMFIRAYADTQPASPANEKLADVHARHRRVTLLIY